MSTGSHGEISTEIDSEGAPSVHIPLVEREEEPLCPSLAMNLPPASADIRRILASVGSNLLSVGSVVGLQAADAAVVVGAAVGIQAERVIMSTAQIVPRYSSQEMSKVISRKNALLDELSQSCMRLGLMEDKEKEMSLLIRELNLKEAELHERQLEEHTRANILESQLTEMSANTVDLRKENEMMSCQLQMIRAELSAETFINESLRAKVDEMQALSDAQDILLQQIRSNEDRAQQLLSDTTIELEAAKEAREKELEAVQSDIEQLIADQVALRAEMRIASEQSLAQLSGLI
jgi:chromosome segregation ATPase